MKLSTQELSRHTSAFPKNLETSNSMEYGWPGWRGSSAPAPAATLPPVATITNRDHPHQKASMLDEVFVALNVLAEGDDHQFTSDVDSDKHKDAALRASMHPAALYDPHRSAVPVSWAQISAYNGHDPGHYPPGPPPPPPPPHLASPPAGTPGLYGQDFRTYTRGHVLHNGGIFPSPPFSTSSQVMSPPPHQPGGGSAFDSPVRGGLEHHSPSPGAGGGVGGGGGYSTPHGAYTTPSPSHTPLTPAKSPSGFQNGSHSNNPSPHQHHMGGDPGLGSPTHHPHLQGNNGLITTQASDPGLGSPTAHHTTHFTQAGLTTQSSDPILSSPSHQMHPGRSNHGPGGARLTPAPHASSTTPEPPPLVPVPSTQDGYTLSPSMPNHAQVLAVNHFQNSEKKCAVPPISTLLNPVSVNNTPSTMQLSATPPNLTNSQDVQTTVLPPLETVIRDDHKRVLFSSHPHHHVTERSSMPDIIRTHTCHKCHRIECSCEQDINSMAGVNMYKSRLQCQKCHKSFSYEKRLEQHLDMCRMKGEQQDVHRSGDPSLQCPGCGKQFKSVRWLEWHKENKCSVIDKRAKLDEFSLKVQKIHAQAELASRQERGEPLEFGDVRVKQEYEVTAGEACDLRCRKCSTPFTDEGLLRGHEELCNGPISEQGMVTMYAKDVLAMLTSDGEVKTEQFDNEAAQSPAQQATGSRRNASVSSPDRKSRIQCEHCEKSFTLMTNKNRHARKAHGVHGYGDNNSRSPVAHSNKMLDSDYQQQQQGNNNNNHHYGSSESSSDDSNANTCSKSDNSLLIAALNQSLGSNEEPPTTMIAELLNVINQSSLPVEADDVVAATANQNTSSTTELTNQQQLAHDAALANHVASASSPSCTQAANPISAQLLANQIPVSTGGAFPANQQQIPVPDLTYEDTKHQVVVTVTAAKQPMMADDNSSSGSNGHSPLSHNNSNNAAANENASIAISENNNSLSHVESGLMGSTAPSPSFKARGGGPGGGRGRRRNPVVGTDPASCSSPSQSSDGSANGEGNGTFPTRLTHGRYVCGICEASFTFQTNLTRHQRKLHGKPYVRNPRKGERESPPSGSGHHHHAQHPHHPQHRDTGGGRSPPTSLGGAGVHQQPSRAGEVAFDAPGSYLNAHHMLPGPPPQQHDSQGSNNSYHHQQAPHVGPSQHETPIQHDVMLNQDTSSDNTEIQLMEQTPTVMKVEDGSSQDGSPSDRYTDLSSYESTIPYNAL